jgi:Protein of unknown function (DUF3341).
MLHATTDSKLYGLVAEFEEPEDILAAAEKAYDAGYRKMDAYSPYPVHGLADAIRFKDNRVPWMIFFCGLSGAAGGLLLQYFTSSIDYPWNVGGKPFFSWPAFIPVTFEITILLSAFGAVFGMLAMNGLPRPYHSIFNAPRFERASQDRFFLCIEADDPRFDIVETARFLRGFNALNVAEVER